ncbi:hypothetical protein VR7878_03269 [Vibrio ruber DSM 16370]|uniref:Uncharacterized protein n=1 Tax=Vibrio ruber (strain DSM 16370 / JCM 11486 / BCRC 17186 / CECT 7878 / LMG 23124 / VR1) TaxID=1123498 RepID=A0A1R4LS85_VIBR1|nr:hypothetical protein VR7878_03269 [Vibrio ruber DSM 16370]
MKSGEMIAKLLHAITRLMLLKLWILLQKLNAEYDAIILFLDNYPSIVQVNGKCRLAEDES